MHALLVLLLTWTSVALTVPRCPAQVIELTEATVADLSRALDRGTLTSERLVQLYLNRIAAYDDQGPELNSIITLNEDALMTARALDLERSSQGSRGPLHGIPVLLKDLSDVAGMPTSGGTLALKDSIPPDDSFIASKLRAAGAVILGKTNTDEFAFGVRGWSSVIGQTRNPYDARRVAGGSSGGTAAAIAASLGTIGTGTDNWGSVRLPAAWNGLVGLRPTLGLVSREGTMILSLDRDTVGPIGKSVEDVSIMLDVIAGFDPRDEKTALGAGHIPSSYRDGLSLAGLEGLRIGVVQSYVDAAPTAIRTLVEAAIDDLALAGAEIVDDFTFGPQPDLNRSFYFGFEYLMNRYLDELGPDAAFADVQELIASNEYSPHLWDGLFSSLRGDVPQEDDPLYGEIASHRADVAEGFQQSLAAENLDFVVYPTVSDLPAFSPTTSHWPSLSTWVPSNISPFLGLPAISVPAGLTSDGLPVGIELMGPAFSEATLLGAAYAYEQRANHRLSPLTTPSLPGETIYSADLNSDGKVDSEDLAAWEEGFGTVYDGHDFLAWQRQYIGDDSLLPVDAGVPEPATVALLTIGSAVILILIRPN